MHIRKLTQIWYNFWYSFNVITSSVYSPKTNPFLRANNDGICLKFDGTSLYEIIPIGKFVKIKITNNILTCIDSLNTWTSRDFPLVHQTLI